MLDLLKEESNKTYTRTENDAATYAGSGSDVLDFFAAVGALRSAKEAEIVVRFTRAFAEDPMRAWRRICRSSPSTGAGTMCSRFSAHRWSLPPFA